jgi:F-type H+-transporting ATPase subunit delta
MTKYAKALHQLAVEQKKVDKINLHFDEIRSLVSKNPKWIEMMDSPMLNLDEKMDMINALDFDSLFLSFLKTLAQEHLMQHIDETYEEWMHLMRASQKIAHLHVYLANPITNIQEEKLMNVLKPRFKGQTISLHKTIDKSLIGGIKIVYHGQSLDRSVVRELEELYTMI